MIKRYFIFNFFITWFTDRSAYLRPKLPVCKNSHCAIWQVEAVTSLGWTIEPPSARISFSVLYIIRLIQSRHVCEIDLVISLMIVYMMQKITKSIFFDTAFQACMTDTSNIQTLWDGIGLRYWFWVVLQWQFLCRADLYRHSMTAWQGVNTALIVNRRRNNDVYHCWI